MYDVYLIKMVINCVEMDHILQTYNSILRPNIKTVISCDDFGISKNGINVVSFDKTNLSLNIPYAARMLSWEVNFLEDNLAFAPDFTFDDDFLDDPDDNILQHVPALSSWNIEDDDALLNVIKQLLTLYSEHQLRTLTDDSRLLKIASDYKELLDSDNDVERSRVELYINYDIVHFVIAMDVDFSGLPPYSYPLVFSNISDPGENVAYLHIAIDANSRRCQSNLQLSPQVDFALGGGNSMLIPPITVEINMTQYVALIRNLLKDKVAIVVDHYNSKMDFIQQILSIYSTSILEYDVVKYEQISLLVGEGDDLVEVIISIDPAYPQERPKVKVNSIYQEQNGKPKTINVHSYTYHPKLPTNDIINNIFTKLRDVMKSFK